MDGYVKNKKEALRSVKMTIFWKFAVSFPILLFILVELLGIYSLGSPDDWKRTEVVYSHISSESIRFQRRKYDVLNAEDGRKYVIPSKLISAEQLKESLIAGETYTLVYSETIAGVNHIKELCNAQSILLDQAVSSAAWKEERQKCFLGLYITIGLATIALIFIDRLWCKNEHARIQKLRQDIEKRNARIAQKEREI